MPPVSCAAKAFPPPALPHLPQPPETDKTIPSQLPCPFHRWGNWSSEIRGSFFNIQQSRSNRIVFSTYVQTCVHLWREGGFWRGKPSPLSPTLLESYRGGGCRVQSPRAWLPVFAKHERANSVFSPSNSTLLALYPKFWVQCPHFPIKDLPGYTGVGMIDPLKRMVISSIGPSEVPGGTPSCRHFRSISLSAFTQWPGSDCSISHLG